MNNTKEELLNLYNVLNDSTYTVPEELEESIETIEKIIAEIDT